MFNISEFKLGSPGLSKVMGDLEATIMERVWAMGEASVRDVYESILSDRKIAYTTVMTIMGRLEKKKFLQKSKQGASFIYYPVLSKEEFEQEAMDQVIEGLVEGFGSKVLSRLLGHDKVRLDEKAIKDLEQLIETYKNNPPHV